MSKAITFANSKLFVYDPVVNLWLIITLNGFDIISYKRLTNLLEIPSWPELDLQILVLIYYFYL